MILSFLLIFQQCCLCLGPAALLLILFYFYFLMNVYFDGIMDLASLVKHGSCISVTNRGQGR